MECAMCGEDRQLVRSHIVPEFLHKAVYDDNHRTLLVKHTEPCTRIVQKGKRERLLCEACEQTIGCHEKWFADYWYQTRPIPPRIDEPDLQLSGLDYASLKLFLLSIAWRASISSLPDFRQANLGPHESAIGKMLLAQEAGTASDYPVIGLLLVEPKSRELWDNVLLFPLSIKVEGQWMLRMVFGGAAWTVITSSHRVDTFSALELKESGTIHMLVQSVAEFAVQSGLSEVARRAGESLSS